MVKDFSEKRIEVFVLFQEKLAIKINDSFFRQQVLESLMYSGITNENLNRLTENVLQEEELQKIVESLLKDGYKEKDLKKELRILLKKLIERFSKFNTEEVNDDYIG